MSIERYRERHKLGSHKHAVGHAASAGLMIALQASPAPAEPQPVKEESAMLIAEHTPESLHVEVRCMAYVTYSGSLKIWQVHMDLIGEFVAVEGAYLNPEAALDVARKEAKSRGYSVVAESHGQLSRTLVLAPCDP